MAALMMGRGEIDRKGVYPVEALDPAPFLRHLPEFGILIQEKQLA
jgi:saccharopine dehydrogenase-like NADP-dependent oxidoreductase